MQFEALASIVAFISSLGATIVSPILITVIAIGFGAPLIKSARAGIAFGIGLIGIFSVLGLIIGALDPIARALVETVGFRLRILDMGWPYWYVFAVGWWGMPLVYVVGLVFNIVMILLGSERGGTDSISIYDMCVIYAHYSMIVYFFWIATGNLVMGLVFGLFAFWLTLRTADLGAPLSQDPECYSFPDITFTHPFNGMQPKALFIDKYILSKIPVIAKSKADPVALRERFGLIGDPIFVGFFIGLALGLFSMTTGKVTLPQALTLTMAMAATMLLMPRMVGILMEGALPVADAAKEFAEKRLKGRIIYMGMDWAIAAGNISMIAAGAIAVPIILAIALLLPGNMVLPYGDLGIAMCLGLWFVPASKGNVLRSVVGMALLAIPLFYIAGFFAPMCHAGAVAFGMPIPAGMIVTAMSEAWHTWIVTIPIVALYLLGGQSGRDFISGKATFGYEIFDPTFAFAFCAVWMLLDIPCWWLTRDDPIRIAKTPKDELIEKGMRSLEAVKKAEKKK